MILAVVFAGAGAMKVAGLGPTREHFEQWVEPISKWVTPTQARIGVGIVELGIFGAAVAGITGSAAATQIAGLLTIWVMIGALLAHAMAGDPPKEVAPAIVVLIVAIALLLVIT